MATTVNLTELVALHGPNKPPMYLPVYEGLLAPLRARPVSVLELGVQTGRSLLVWRDYFPKGAIVGLDRQIPDMGRTERIRLFAGEQDDPQLLDYIGTTCGPFDLIIDDCAHIGVLAAASYHCLFRHLTHGGLYAIEDWGTGYWPHWKDGAAWRPGHTAGMVGFIKDIVDETGRYFLDRSGIERLIITAGLAIVVRA